MLFMLDLYSGDIACRLAAKRPTGDWIWRFLNGGVFAAIKITVMTRNNK